MEKKLSVGQNTLYNSLGSIVYLVCQWLITILVVHLGSYEDAGDLSLAMSISNVFYTIATFGVREYQVSDYENKYSTGSYVTTRLVSCACSTLLCCVVVLVIGQYTPHQTACILLYMLFRIVEALIDVFQAIEQKAERMDFTCLSFLVRGILILGVFCGAMALTHDLLIAIAGMALFSFGAALTLDLTVCRRLTRLKLTFSPATTVRLLRACAPLMCNSLLTSAIVALPRSQLEALWGSYLLGIYASVATPAVIVQSAATWIYNPTLTTFTRHYVQKDKKNFYALYRKIWLVIAACVAAVCVGATLLGEWGLGLLFNEEIVEYSYLLLPVLLTTILIACSYFLGALLTITRHMKIIVAANAVAMALVLLFSNGLVDRLGMDGVNYVIYLAMGANVVILFSALTLILHRHFKEI